MIEREVSSYFEEEKGRYRAGAAGGGEERITDMQSKKGKILVVDDMLIHLETAKLYLETSGYQVVCASDVKSAWRLVTEEEPDLILLDVIMPT